MVSDDMLGKFSDYQPTFVRKYVNLKSIILDSAKQFCQDIKDEKYPSEKEVFNLKEEEKEKLLG